MHLRTEFRIVSTVSIGGLLEWYEFSLFAYLAPVFARTFFPSSSEIGAIINVLLIFFVGFLSRPLGAILFGYIGDRYGRRIALLSSIVMITIPTMGIGILPSFETIGFLAPLILMAMRLLQGLFVGGEIPGAICYLVESVPFHRRRYISSWTFFGSQIGAVLAIGESLYLEHHLSHADLIDWGWRASFLAGGLLGLFACFLRYGLKETPVFEEMSKAKNVSESPVTDAFRYHKKGLFLGFCISALPLAGYFLFFSFAPVYFQKILGIPSEKSLTIVALFLIFSTLLLPVFGKLSPKFKTKELLLASTFGTLLLAYPFFLAIPNLLLPFLFLLGILLTLLLSCYFSLFPVFIAELFPGAVRYSCVGLSYNMSSGLIGGLAPVLALYLIDHTNNPAMPVFILLIAGILSLLALFLSKKNR